MKKVIVLSHYAVIVGKDQEYTYDDLGEGQMVIVDGSAYQMKARYYGDPVIFATIEAAHFEKVTEDIAFGAKTTTVKTPVTGTPPTTTNPVVVPPKTGTTPPPAPNDEPCDDTKDEKATAAMMVEVIEDAKD